MRRKHWSSDPGYKQKYWTEGDWADWVKHGRPPVPWKARIGNDEPLPLDMLPAVPPQHTLPGGFELHPPKRRRGRDNARAKEVDRLLALHGVRLGRSR